ncbi:MAG: NAD(P)/FAD-dependent oxidoreductase [bacterium]
MMSKTILVLGGGIGGLVVANGLRKKLAREHEVILVDKKTKHEFNPSFLWVLTGKRKVPQICRNLQLLEKKGIQYINAEVRNIDVGNKQVNTSVKNISYDFLVIALGAELAPESIPGLSESGYNLYQLEEIPKLRDSVKNFTSGTLMILVCKLPFKCPAAPYESALLMDYLLREKGLRDKIEIKLFTPEGIPMKVAGSKVGEAVKQMLREREIVFNPNHQPTSIDPEKKEVHFGDKKENFDLLVYVPPHKIPKVLEKTDLVNETGWVGVNPRTLETKFQGVFSLGDAVNIKLPSGLALPKAGVFAHGEAEVVAKNIVAQVNEEQPKHEFGGKGSCFLEIGYGKAAYAKGNFYQEPEAQVKMWGPGGIWHWGKILFEKWWLWRWF